MKIQKYLYNVLEPVALPYFHQLENPIFQQYNTRRYTIAVTTNFLRKFQVTVLIWPDNSPDLSPIENV